MAWGVLELVGGGSIARKRPNGKATESRAVAAIHARGIRNGSMPAPGHMNRSATGSRASAHVFTEQFSPQRASGRKRVSSVRQVRRFFRCGRCVRSPSGCLSPPRRRSNTYRPCGSQVMARSMRLPSRAVRVENDSPSACAARPLPSGKTHSSGASPRFMSNSVALPAKMG